MPEYPADHRVPGDTMRGAPTGFPELNALLLDLTMPVQEILGDNFVVARLLPCGVDEHLDPVLVVPAEQLGVDAACGLDHRIVYREEPAAHRLSGRPVDSHRSHTRSTSRSSSAGSSAAMALACRSVRLWAWLIRCATASPCGPITSQVGSSSRTVSA
jgi:hypothetical protein